VTRPDARYVRKQARDVDRLIVGCGQYGNVELSPQPAAYLKRKKCRVVLAPTPSAISFAVCWADGELFTDMSGNVVR
jgi:hypothetical protein